MLLFSIGPVSAESSFSKVIEDSPYPEFIYIDNRILPEISKEYINENIPSFLYFFIDGIYIDGHLGGVAIKTPLWQIVGLAKSLNLFSKELENIHPENGFLFINSKYKGAPQGEDSRRKYIIQDYDDLIVYLNGTILCAKFENNNITYLNMITSKDEIPYEGNIDEKTIVELINGLKSIDGIKVKKSNAKIEGDIIVINMVLEASISDIKKLTNINLNYVPIKVKVKGDWIKENNDEDKYIRDSDYIIYTLPFNKDATLTMINSMVDLDIISKKVGEYNHQGWYVEEYQYTYGGYTIKQYICIKELEYGTVCVITNKLENLNDIEIYEEKS
ncbi:MAG TPA: hypothetical protein EYG76_04395 [Methanothermococcus okinawensis]|uniref:Uncharacterized protein n=1 Tax=Methanothermococcus okinawensis TaxID=155863 RepID=A0A832YTR3_9EURY|nr:hypothetical protein [Methanothermococcus okinawensis]